MNDQIQATLTVAKVLKSGEEFQLNELFSDKIWKKMKPTTFGKRFKSYVLNNPTCGVRHDRTERNNHEFYVVL